MPPYARVVGMYERFSVLSSAAIRREVQMLLGTSTPQPSLLLQLRDICQLLVKCGEWQRALVVVAELPHEQEQSLMSLFQLTHVHTQGPSGSDAQKLGVSGDSVPSALELSKMSNEELLRLGFALQRSKQRPKGEGVTGSNSSPSVTSRVRDEQPALGDVLDVQRRLFIEFRRRNRCKELIQCVKNWNSKGLIPTKQTTSKWDSVDCSDRYLHSVREGNEDAADAGASMAAPFNAEMALQSLIFNTSPGNLWEEALRESSDFFLKTLRDPGAALQFLRKTSVDTLIRLVLSILNDNDASIVPMSPVLGPAASSRYCGQEPQVQWSTVSSLCFALRPHLVRETKTVKTDLLHALLRALRREALVATTTAEGVSDSATAGARWRTGPGAAGASNDESYQAMRSAVEGLCVPLAHHHEAQAWFVGLPLFTEVAISLRECGLSIPNALAQCVFLCLGDPQRHQWRGPPASLLASSSSLSFLSSHVHAQPEVELLITMLNASPADRWISALRLLHLWGEQRSFVVTSAHLRSMLSGLQSICVNRMWPVALRVAQSIMAQHHVVPDESSVAKLMLSLHAASWQRAFEVLQLYEKKHISPSPLILRDLHVVALRHSSWEVVLRLMHQIELTGPQYASFMNYVYCLRAYGCAGKCSEASELFKTLKDVPGVVGRSAYNEVTIGVPVLGMMEHQHWDCVVRFVAAIRHCCGVELTREGWHVLLAAELLALTHIGDAAKVASFLNRHSALQEDVIATTTPATTMGANDNDGDEYMVRGKKGLRGIVEKAAHLQTLLGMEHLNAPIRLAFEQLACDSNRYHHNAPIGTPSRSTPSRPPLYLPPHHVRLQHEWMATALGRMVHSNEQLFSVGAQQALAEAMSTVGAGPVYLKAALL